MLFENESCTEDEDPFLGILVCVTFDEQQTAMFKMFERFVRRRRMFLSIFEILIKKQKLIF